MPELPEVETVMRGLAACLDGHVIRRAEVRRADMRWPLPKGLAKRLTGARVEGFRRRGKYILMRLDGGDSLLIHLGMSGRMLISPAGINDIPAHEHVMLETDSGMRVGFVDPRRFGSVDLLPTADEDTHKLLAGMGPEPLGADFTAKFLAGKLAGKRTPIKAALLDQHIVAGLGNIYVCEALHRAGVSPERPAGEVSKARIERLVTAVRDVLAEAIEAGGSTLRDYAAADGALGYFQHRFRAYGREHEPCPKDGCRGVIRRIVQSGRSSFFCAECQR